MEFLDIEIFKGPDFARTGVLSTRLYQKPLNAFLYLHPSSSHPKHVFGAFIAERIRAARTTFPTDSVACWLVLDPGSVSLLPHRTLATVPSLLAPAAALLRPE